MCELAILKIAAVVESCGIEPVEWDKKASYALKFVVRAV